MTRTVDPRSADFWRAMAAAARAKAAEILEEENDVFGEPNLVAAANHLAAAREFGFEIDRALSVYRIQDEDAAEEAATA